MPKSIITATMTKNTFDPSKLQAFDHAAAGHDGVLSDPTGALVVKPCTRAEVNFYESVTASHPDLAPHLPTFLGTLSLSADQATATDALAAESGTIVTDDGIVERLHGKKLDTDLHIVLENITHGFKKPNVLDLKLGAQLWDEGAKPEKRVRLDKVSQESTSGSLGFRIAGMRTRMGESESGVNIGEKLAKFVEDSGDGYLVYNKMYGRSYIQTENIADGFWAYVLPQGVARSSKRELARASEVLSYFLGEVNDIIKAFEAKESRMYSASLLLVYEGDVEQYEKTKEVLLTDKTQGEDTEDEEEEGDLPKIAAVKVIDFAHATWVPGQGPDENALRGMRSTSKILGSLLEEVEKQLGG